MTLKYVSTKPLRLRANLGEEIEKRRKALKLSMLAAADKAGLRESHWSTLESKSAGRMGLITADRVAFALGCTLDQLYLQAKK